MRLHTCFDNDHVTSAHSSHWPHWPVRHSHLYVLLFLLTISYTLLLCYKQAKIQCHTSGWVFPMGQGTCCLAPMWKVLPLKTVLREEPNSQLCNDGNACSLYQSFLSKRKLLFSLFFLLFIFWSCLPEGNKLL